MRLADASRSLHFAGMKWIVWIAALVAVAAFILLRRASAMEPEAARDWLKRGAKVIDVRSEAEYQQKHLPGTINIPLNRLRDEIGKCAPDKEQGLLLHCASGARSGMGKGILEKMGYQHVFNLGSYGQAAKALGDKER